MESARTMSSDVRWRRVLHRELYITPSRSVPEIDSETSTNCSIQANHRQRGCGNESKNLVTASKFFLGSSSEETFLNKPRSGGCKRHSLRTYSAVSSRLHLQ